MAITLADFDKIWASTSPLTPYSFSESNYKQGWNFIGSTPPARQMWDFLQKNNDEKMQYIVNNYAPITSNAGSHNSVYRGKNLGTSVTAEQYAEISVGTFRDMYIGDYWVINAVTWRIADFDYFFNVGDGSHYTTTHHIVIVPDSALASSVQMNSTDTTAGAYVGSDFYTGANDNTGRATALTAVNNAFGSAHVLSHQEMLANTVTNSVETGNAWYDCTVELMTEIMVYGSRFYWNFYSSNTSPANFVSSDRSQFSLFRYNPSYQFYRSGYTWLRNVATDRRFCVVTRFGQVNMATPANTYYIRPYFCLKA